MLLFSRRCAVAGCLPRRSMLTQNLCPCVCRLILQRHNRTGLSIPEVCAALLHGLVDAHVLPSLQKALALQWNFKQPSVALFVVQTLSSGVCSTAGLESLLTAVHNRYVDSGGLCSQSCLAREVGKRGGGAHQRRCGLHLVLTSVAVACLLCSLASLWRASCAH